jgi:hypothetical protein
VRTTLALARAGWSGTPIEKTAPPKNKKNNLWLSVEMNRLPLWRFKPARVVAGGAKLASACIAFTHKTPPKMWVTTSPREAGERRPQPSPIDKNVHNHQLPYMKRAIPDHFSPPRLLVSRADMRLELQFTKSGRKFRLWHVLLAVAVLGTVCGLVPEHIGAPIVFGFICLGVVTIVACVILFVVQKLRGN